MTWKGESNRHAMSARGISTKTQNKKMQSIHSKLEILNVKSKDVLERTDKLMKKIYEMQVELFETAKKYRGIDDAKADEYYDMAKDLYSIHHSMSTSVVEFRRYIDTNRYNNDIKRIKEIEEAIK